MILLSLLPSNHYYISRECSRPLCKTIGTLARPSYDLILLDL